MEILLLVLLVVLIFCVLVTGGLVMVMTVSLAESLGLKRGRAPAEDAGEDREDRAGKMDEGFENLMTFSVKGKTGFEMGDE